MKNKLSILILLIVIILFYFILKFYQTKKNEKFSQEFESSLSSKQFFEYIDMGDHKTIVFLQKGNSGNNVILLHNSPVDYQIWKPLYQTLQRISLSGTKIPNLITYDLRGHGTAWIPVDNKYNDTNINNTIWNIEMYVNDLKKIYDKFVGNGKVIICGFGLGGLIGQKFSLTYPDLISRLTLLQTSIEPPLKPLLNVIEELSIWIKNNPNITYLTLPENIIQNIICQFFYLPNNKDCPIDKLVDKNDLFDDQLTPQYNLISSLFRESSATTFLQTQKLTAAINLENEWINAKYVNFDIYILASTDDTLRPSNDIMKSYTTIYNNNRKLLVILDIVNGKHGFSIMRPDYIAGIICKECKKFSSSSTFLNYEKQHGY